ncbi:serine/threonine-protein phosphatase 6 regulatory ankyrin repeat subunit B-like isoform X2 [Montipora capricornis]|uniref:serine/threonine-protein phosphatase 6 regulatory ankyrin repeat subunit B-like isoform X2 n=1 Tax=Montipora capricornis TaxID=246305 RepID=UPI0035F1C957
MAESIPKDTITEFLTAARKGHEDELRKMLQEAPNLVNCSNDQGQTALMFASTFNYVKCCEVLFESNVDVNKRDCAGNTPLHFARDITVAQGLLKRGASVTWKNVLGRSPLLEACIWGEMQLFEELLSKFSGRISEVKDKEGTTLLHLATISKVEECRIDKINLLLSLGADVNEVNLCGRPAIVMACKNSDEHVARYLVQHGADPNLSDFFGHNALHSCFLDYPLGLLDFGAFRPKSGLLKLLAPLMANVNVATATGMTALHLAAQRGKADDIRIILEAGGNPLTRDNLGRTPLHFSMFNPFPEVFQIMFDYCKKGSDSLPTDDLGRSVLHYAAACASPEVFEASITCVTESYQLASEINLQDDYGKSPLYYFFMHGKREEGVLESLLQNGAKVNDLPALTMATYSKQLKKSPEENSGVETQPQSRNETDLNSSENLLSSCLQEINVTDSESVEPANLRPIADNREFLEQVALLTSESKEHKDIREQMNLSCETFMTALSREVEKRDPRFTFDVIPSGSSYENTKLTTGNSVSDFDYMTSLMSFNKIVTAVESVEFPMGYIMLKLVKHPEVTTDLDFNEFFHDGYLIGRKVSERLCQLILEVINNSTVWKENPHMYFLGKDSVCTWSDGSPAIKLNLRWTGCMSMPSKSISCDIVPSLHIPGWWPSFARQASVVLKPNVKAGCYVVLKQPDVPFYGVAKFGNPECFFRVSFSPAEFEIFRNMSEDVRKSFVVVKALSKRKVKVSGKLVGVPMKGVQILSSHLISTYLLKNALFHTLECFLEDSAQDQDQLEYLVCGVFKRFVASQALYYSVDKKEQKHSFEKMKVMLPAEEGKVYEKLHRSDKSIRYFLWGNEGNS